MVAARSPTQNNRPFALCPLLDYAIALGMTIKPLTKEKPKPVGKAARGPRKTPPASPYGSRRDQVVARALSMFNELGVGPVSTNHIAASVGISPGNLYYHFRNKEDIVWALLEAMRSDIRDHLGRQLGEDPFALLRLLFEGAVDIMWRYRFFVEDRGAVRRLGPKFAAAGRQFQADFVDMAVAFFQAARVKGWMVDGLSDVDLRRIVGNLYIISTSGIEFSRNQAGHEHATRADVEEGQRQAFHFLLPYFKPETLPIVRAQFDL